MANRKLMWEEADKRTYREPTADELRIALLIERNRERLENELYAIESQLKEMYAHESKVFYDEAGFPYDTRIYIASGHGELI